MKLAVGASLAVHVVLIGGLASVQEASQRSAESILFVTPVSSEVEAQRRKISRSPASPSSVPRPVVKPGRRIILSPAKPEASESNIEGPSIESAVLPNENRPNTVEDTATSGRSADNERRRISVEAKEGEAELLADYLLEVRDQLAGARQYPWRARLLAQEGVAEIRFRIASSGESADINLVRSSTFELLDREAIATVARAGRFPPPPVSEPEGLVIRVPIWFQLKDGRTE